MLSRLFFSKPSFRAECNEVEKSLNNKKMQKGGYIYIMTNYQRSTLYIGVTSDLAKRIYEHQNKVYPLHAGYPDLQNKFDSQDY